jgi:hypothetical protein
VAPVLRYGLATTASRYPGPFAPKRPNEFLTNISGFSIVSASNISLALKAICIRSREANMSITMFLAFCILGCDFMLYVLFQWIYGEKHRNRARRLATRRENSRTLPGKEAGKASVVSFPQGAMHY